MAILEILEYPDPRLRTVAKQVVEVTTNTHKITTNMLETMYESKGLGLAATQVNIHLCIVVMDTSKNYNTPIVMINPSYKELTDEKSELKEGCLSVPGFYQVMGRTEKIKLTATNIKGEKFTMELTGIASVCVQHELDHLRGKLFIDDISPLKLSRIKKKLEKAKKRYN